MKRDEDDGGGRRRKTFGFQRGRGDTWGIGSLTSRAALHYKRRKGGDSVGALHNSGDFRLYETWYVG